MYTDSMTTDSKLGSMMKDFRSENLRHYQSPATPDMEIWLSKERASLHWYAQLQTFRPYLVEGLHVNEDGWSNC